MAQSIGDWLDRALGWLSGLDLMFQLLVIGAIILVLVFFPQLVRRLFSGRKVSEISIGLAGIRVRLAADRIAKANAIWDLPSPDAKDIQSWLAGLVRIPHVLWVYDDPKSVENEIKALELLGYEITVVRTNAAAAKHYRSASVDVIVSDIDRKAEGEEAGLKLREALSAVRTPVPPIFYYVGQVDAPKTPDGDPVTNTPLDLFRLIGGALDGGAVATPPAV